MRQHCEICELETEWEPKCDLWEDDWCKVCGCSKEMFEPQNNPGGCEMHPEATHEQGYGLAAGGCGLYSVCNECGRFFDVIEDPFEA